jgi:hypothetical protein
MTRKIMYVFGIYAIFSGIFVLFGFAVVLTGSYYVTQAGSAFQVLAYRYVPPYLVFLNIYVYIYNFHLFY